MIPFRVTSHTPDGQDYDVTPHISSLSFSNVNPGGDETASLGIRQKWGSERPEIRQGSTVTIAAGIDVLWRGRIEEIDRSTSEVEEITVTCYGLGVRLKDAVTQMVFVDRSLDSWGPPTLNHRLVLANGSQVPDIDYKADVREESLQFDGTSRATENIPAAALAELMYVMPEGLLASIFAYSCQTHGPVINREDPPRLRATDDDTLATGSWDIYALTSSSSDDPDLQTQALDDDRRFLMLRMASTANHTPATPERLTFRRVAVYGDHGLAIQDNDNEPGGFTASQIVSWVVANADGITIRKMDASGTIIDHFTIPEPTPSEDVVNQANEYEGFTWGTWGPDSPLDMTDTGYFDWNDRSETITWRVPREQLAALSLHQELSSIYNVVSISYEDQNGRAQRFEKRGPVPVLDRAGITRTAAIDGGQLTNAVARSLGETFLRLAASRSPARGTITVERPIHHVDRGLLPPYRLRADGSNLQVPDLYPADDLIGLNVDADRLTTFPIKRVEVAADETRPPQVRVELDQDFDALSLLQARLQLAGEFSRVRSKHRHRGNRGRN